MLRNIVGPAVLSPISAAWLVSEWGFGHSLLLCGCGLSGPDFENILCGPNSNAPAFCSASWGGIQSCECWMFNKCLYPDCPKSNSWKLTLWRCICMTKTSRRMWLRELRIVMYFEKAKWSEWTQETLEVFGDLTSSADIFVLPNFKAALYPILSFTSSVWSTSWKWIVEGLGSLLK